VTEEGSVPSEQRRQANKLADRFIKVSAPLNAVLSFGANQTQDLGGISMARNKEEFLTKVNRAHAARIKAEEFVLAGGDLKSEEAAPLGIEMLEAWNDLATEFAHPVLKDISKK